MKYAVITSGGKQYKVQEGEALTLDKLSQKEGEIRFDNVLLMVTDGAVQLGDPYVAGVAVTAKILGEEKGEKIRISKFKSKVRYRRVTGFRSKLTRIQIEQIGPAGAKKADVLPAAAKEEKAAVAKKTVRKAASTSIKKAK